MVYVFIAAVFVSFPGNGFNLQADSLRKVWENIKTHELQIPTLEKIAVLDQLAGSLRTNLPDSALSYYQQALDLALEAGMKHEEARLRNKIGYTHYILGNYDFALTYFVNALELHRALHNDVGISTSLNSIGLIYEAQVNYPKALEYQWNSIVYSERTGSSERLNSNYFNLSIIHDHLGNFDSALYYLNKSVAISKAEKDNTMLCMALNRMGEVNLHKNDLSQAESNFRNSLQQIPSSNLWEACFSYAGLSQVYSKQGKYDESIAYGLKSFNLANQLNSKWDIARSAGILYEVYKKKSDFREALHMLEIHKRFNDSLFNVRKESEINFLLLRQNESERGQLAKENALQKSIIEQGNLWIGFFIILGILLAIWGLVLYQNNRHKLLLNEELRKTNESIGERNAKIEQQNKELKALNDSKNQLLSIVGHDMRSPINNIKTILEIIKDGRLSAADQERVFNELHKSVSAVAETMNNMLIWASSQLKGLQTNPTNIELQQLVKETIAIFQTPASEKGIELIHEERAGIFVYADINHLKTALRNLINNAIKFTKRNGKVTIRYDHGRQNGDVVIDVIDSGVGIEPDRMSQIFKFTGRSQSIGTNNERGTGIGLMLSQEFIESNHGRIEVSSTLGVGSKFTIHLPVANLIGSPLAST